MGVWLLGSAGTVSWDEAQWGWLCMNPWLVTALPGGRSPVGITGSLSPSGAPGVCFQGRVPSYPGPTQALKMGQASWPLTVEPDDVDLSPP